MVHTSVEEKRNSEKKVSSHLSHLKSSSQTSEHDETEDHQMQSPDVPDNFSDMNLRYNYVGLGAFKDKAYKVIFPSC